MKLTWTAGTLKMREPFRISRGVMYERDAVTLRLEHDGVVGRGEVVASIYYELDTARIDRLLASVQHDVECRAAPENLLLDPPETLSEAPGVMAALDAAVHDLLARQREVPVHALLGTPEWKPTPTAYTIGITSTELAVESARDLIARGFTLLKVKLGGADEAEELDRIAAIRSAAPEARLLLDPNGGWEPRQAVRMLEAAREHGVQAVEQPIAAGTPDLLAKVARDSPVPVIADEDAAGLDDVRALGDLGMGDLGMGDLGMGDLGMGDLGMGEKAMGGPSHGINIKLAKCGGIQAARDLIEAAREYGLDVMLGCLAASSLGIAPAAHLAGFARWVDLDGHLLLAHDPWTGLGGEDGVLRIEGDVGLGVHPVLVG